LNSSRNLFDKASVVETRGFRWFFREAAPPVEEVSKPLEEAARPLEEVHMTS
jgi:hypothetical protein